MKDAKAKIGDDPVALFVNLSLPQRPERLTVVPSMMAFHGVQWDFAAETLYYGVYYTQLGELIVKYSDQSASLVRRLKSIGDKSRLEILRAVKDGPCNGQDIAEKLSLAPATISHHMNLLCNEGLPVVSELMSAAQLDAFTDVDVIQIGARNMQNFDLLRALGRSEKPVLLKRGVGAALQELLLSAEYLLAAGNPRVMLCERGIRTFDTFTRGTLDLAAVPALHEMTHLPVLVDPSHAAGRAALVMPLALAAAACGADGVMVEMHPDPLHARCDGAQALLPEELAALSQRLHAVREACR